MKRILSRIVKQNALPTFKITKRHIDICADVYNFDSDEEIVENRLETVMLVGINLPEQRNNLTENAVEKLTAAMKKFNESDLKVAVLHGMGGNFCLGLESNERALKKGKALIEMLGTIKKPIIASLDGYTKNFGFQLAVMCDLKTMDETGLIGFGSKDNRSHIPDIVYKKLVSSVGITKAMQIVLVNGTLKADAAHQMGLVNMAVECGSALSQAVLWANSIALSTNDLNIQEKSRICKNM